MSAPSIQSVALHRNAPVKPAFGNTCNGCGLCCAAETCPLGRLLYRRKAGPCPALTWSGEDRRYYCGLLLHPTRKRLPAILDAFAKRLIGRWIAAGSGCDCRAETLP